MAEGRKGSYRKFVQEFKEWKDTDEFYKVVGYIGKKDYMDKQEQRQRNEMT